MMRAALAVLVLLVPAIAGAQQVRERAVEVGGGLQYAGPITFARVDGNENAVGGVTRALVKSQSQLDASPGIGVHIGVRLTSMLQAEWSVSLNRTHLATHLTGDAEAADATVSEPVTQYLVEGGLKVRLPRRRGARIAPFAAGGAGYLRQLHDGNTLIDAGPSYYAGGGVDYLLNAAGPRGARIGLRADVRGWWLRDQLTLDRRPHVVPVVGAAMFFRF